MGRRIKSWFITESAVTFLMSRSRTELGKRFNKWLHIEVLPSIRKTGSYSIPDNLREKTINQEEVTINEINETINSIFEGIHIKPELIAGIKLNAIRKLKPRLTPIIEESRQFLIQSSGDDRILLTPTKLGEQLGISGIKVNQLLIEKGLQIENSEVRTAPLRSRKSRKEPKYLPTDYGKEFSTFTLSTGSGDDSTSYQQLKWYDSVLSLLN